MRRARDTHVLESVGGTYEDKEGATEGHSRPGERRDRDI